MKKKENCKKCKNNCEISKDVPEENPQPILASSCQQRVFRNKKQSYCHLVILHGRGAGSLEEPEIRGEARCFPMVEPVDADLLKDLGGMGKPPTFDEIDAEYQDFPSSSRIHISLVISVAKADGQMRSRMETCCLGSAGRSIFEILHTDVLLVSFDHERKCANPCPFRGRIQWSRSLASVTQEIRARYTESSICFDVKDHDARETLCDHAEGFGCSQVLSDDECGTDFSQEQLAVGHKM